MSLVHTIYLITKREQPTESNDLPLKTMPVSVTVMRLLMMGPERGGETSWSKRLARAMNKPAKQKSVDAAEIQMRV